MTPGAGVARHCDAHCHLQDLRPDALDGALRRAGAAGVELMACCAAGEDDWRAVLALAARPGVRPFLGLHPWRVAEARDGWLERLGGLLAAGAAGVGEVGLDRLQGGDLAPQEEALLAQLVLARRLGRPVSIHCVRAWDRLAAVLDRAGDLPAWMIHAYGGGPEQLAPLLERGALVSFAPTLLRRGRERVAAAARLVPAERLLVESDAPDLAPPGCAQSEPAHAALVLARLADLRGDDPAELAGRVLAASRRFLAPLLAPPSSP